MYDIATLRPSGVTFRGNRVFEYPGWWDIDINTAKQICAAYSRQLPLLGHEVLLTDQVGSWVSRYDFGYRVHLRKLSYDHSPIGEQSDPCDSNA